MALLSPATPRAVRIALVLLAAVTAAYAALLLLDSGTPALIGIEDWTYNALLAAATAVCAARVRSRREERVAWLAFTLGLGLCAAGNVYWSLAVGDDPNAPFPSFADGLWWAQYVFLFIGVGLLVRADRGPRGGTLWLDGVIAALATAAVCAAVVVGRVQHSLGDADLGTVATNLSYPVLDLLLLTMAVAGIALRGWRVSRALGWIAAGLVVWAVTDSAYLVLTAEGTYSLGSLVDAGWPVAALLLALAAWQPGARVARSSVPEGWLTFVAPAAFAGLALAVLVVDHFDTVDPLGIALASACLLATIVRMALTFRLNLRMLAGARSEARTDALTGLGNRRALMDELATVEETGHQRALVIFDLNGFKNYNDAFGHPAGDALLARLGQRLGSAVPERGSAFRMGGDEFCALVPAGPEKAESAGRRLARALADRGEGFEVSASWGAVAIPGETADPVAALRMADGRMYAHKHGVRPTAERQSANVLLRALAERDPDLGAHLSEVGGLAAAVAVRLGLDDAEVEHVRHAAELHDVGKVAIPEAILNKPGPLDEDEWAFMRRHTLIGERILSAAPALMPVAALVRSSHERWDGGGYPDGLAGDEIPLGARIVAVCDAYDAMTSDRPYRSGIAHGEALHELRRCACGQFDPRVVEAFTTEAERRTHAAAVVEAA